MVTGIRLRRVVGSWSGMGIIGDGVFRCVLGSVCGLRCHPVDREGLRDQNNLDLGRGGWRITDHGSEIAHLAGRDRGTLQTNTPFQQ